MRKVIYIACLSFSLTVCSSLYGQQNDEIRFQSKENTWKVNRSRSSQLGLYINLNDKEGLRDEKTILYATGLIVLKGRDFHEYVEDKFIICTVNGTPIKFKVLTKVAHDSSNISAYYNILYAPATKSGRRFFSERLQVGMLVTLRDNEKNIIFSLKIDGYKEALEKQKIFIETFNEE